LLWGSHVKLIAARKAMGLSSAGGGHILEPMSLVAIRFLEEGDNGPSEVLPLGRGEILGAGLVELADLLVEFVVHSFLVGSTNTVFDIVAVVPLIPCKVVEADKQALDPPPGQLPTPQRVVVALLDLAPLLGQEAFKEVLPVYEQLGLGSLLDFCFRKVIVGEKATAPPGEVLEKGSLKIRMSSGLHQISGELGHAFRPDLIDPLSLASQDMGRVFRSIALRALVIILMLPFHEGGAHTTIG